MMGYLGTGVSFTLDDTLLRSTIFFALLVLPADLVTMETKPNQLRRLQNSSIITTATVLPTASLLAVRDTETSDSSSTAGSETAIIGGIIGGVVFCVVLRVLFVIFWQRARRDRRVGNNVEDAIDPMTIPNPNPLLSKPVVTQMSGTPSPSESAQTGTVSTSTVESSAPDSRSVSDRLLGRPQFSRNTYEEMIGWLQRQIRHLDREGIVHSSSPAPPSYRSLHRSDIPDSSCST
ncbi:hypothetical protein ARMGADRAFT_1170538 [Armillaria gallica]|uniref:Transmembrane protein n=1 Tax=Armillaria gallica TaxID=47427 RepID=A0A2H3CPH7_ARMGA|nr:hypothetical protein ARMGADRAFT_1170538 [Armillaria gallica]